MKKTMTKADMLTAMTSPGNVKSYLYYNMRIRKAYILEAYRRFTDVSHTSGRRYIEESRQIPERCHKR